jgi:hypothetical protein
LKTIVQRKRTRAPSNPGMNTFFSMTYLQG